MGLYHQAGQCRPCNETAEGVVDATPYLYFCPNGVQRLQVGAGNFSTPDTPEGAPRTDQAPCVAGELCSNGTRVPCPAGSFCTGGGATPCAAGTYSSLPARSMPCDDECPAGAFCPEGASNWVRYHGCHMLCGGGGVPGHRAPAAGGLHKPV